MIIVIERMAHAKVWIITDSCAKIQGGITVKPLWCYMDITLCRSSSGERRRKMKRALLIVGSVMLVMFLLGTTAAFADKGQSLTFRVNYVNPENAKPGVAIGGSFGSSFNDIVTLGLGTDVYYRNYTRDTLVAETVVNGVTVSTVQRELQYSTLIFPLMAELNLKIPIAFKLSFFGDGSIGFEFMRTHVQNYQDSVSEKKWYAGLAWVLGAGIMYEIGRDTDIYLEGFYKNSKVRRDLDGASEYLPIFEEVNLSGIGFRLGIALSL
jgi:hypothetical protein